MNHIEAIRTKSRFVPDLHLVIAIDGKPLDELLDEASPGENIAGLIPSLLGWFHHEEDRGVPWERIFPEIGCTGYAPILICPDDLDYICSVVMVEVVSEPEQIRWDRLGFDATRAGSVGSQIRWEPRFGSYRFPRDQYEMCLAAFRDSKTSPA